MHAISEISNAVEDINNISINIAVAVEEQTATTNEVARVVGESNKAVDNISTMINHVSLAAGQSAVGANQLLDSTKVLRDQAIKLGELVSRLAN